MDQSGKRVGIVRGEPGDEFKMRNGFADERLGLGRGSLSHRREIDFSQEPMRFHIVRLHLQSAFAFPDGFLAVAEPGQIFRQFRPQEG